MIHQHPHYAEGFELPTANLKEILLFAWRRLLHNYRPIVLRSIVTMLFVLAFTFLPALIALMGVINNAIFRGDGGSGSQLSIPILRDLDPTGLITTFASTLFLVPFGMMFASSGSFMIVGVLRKSKEARWSKAYRICLNSRGAGFIAIGIAAAAAVVSFVAFVIPSLLLGFPLLLVVLATIFMMRDKLAASQLVPIPQVAQLLTPSSQSTSSEQAP